LVREELSIDVVRRLANLALGSNWVREEEEEREEEEVELTRTHLE